MGKKPSPPLQRTNTEIRLHNAHVLLTLELMLLDEHWPPRAGLLVPITSRAGWPGGCGAAWGALAAPRGISLFYSSSTFSFFCKVVLKESFEMLSGELH